MENKSDDALCIRVHLDTNLPPYTYIGGFGKWILSMNRCGSCIYGFQHWIWRDRGGLHEMIETLGALVRVDLTMVGDRADFEKLIQPRVMEAESELESDWILSF